MYKLTPKMVQHLEKDLNKYHELFGGGRCAGWELEELFVRAIKCDTAVNHHPIWREAGHDDKADITVKTDTAEWPINIKSGQIKDGYLTLSGHRLGRFKEDFTQISAYLNNHNANMIAVPYDQAEDDRGRHHHYKIAYISTDHMCGLESNGWKEHGKQFVQQNSQGVRFSLRPSMSWQIWWKIPENLIVFERTIVIG